MKLKKQNGQEIKILRSTKNNGNVINQWFPEIYDTPVSRDNDIEIPSVICSIVDFDFFKNNMTQVLKNDRMLVFKTDPTRRVFEASTIFKFGSGTQLVSSFPPIIAKWIYEYYLKDFKDNVLYVLDPCMGWAGRMLGAIAAMYKLDKSITFIGTDVNRKINDRYEKIKKFWFKEIDTTSTVVKKLKDD
jgi:hypothetical protein